MSVWEEARAPIGSRIDGEGVVIDLTAVPDNVITDIEVITLTGSGNNTLDAGGYRRVSAFIHDQHFAGGRQQGGRGRYHRPGLDEIG